MSRAESATVNACGLVQGIAPVTFPAASTIFTARGSYDLSRSQYGVMFVPQMSTAIVASMLSGQAQPAGSCQVSPAGSRLLAWSVVISAGAANSARILLRSASDRHPGGLANGSG